MVSENDFCDLVKHISPSLNCVDQPSDSDCEAENYNQTLDLLPKNLSLRVGNRDI